MLVTTDGFARTVRFRANPVNRSILQYILGRFLLWAEECRLCFWRLGQLNGTMIKGVVWVET